MSRLRQVDRFAALRLATAAQAAAEAEASGYDALWTSENRHDALLPLAPAAQATTSIRLGTGVAIAFARTPMTVAYQAHDLQSFSGGRLLLGLGPQVGAHVRNRFGMPFSAPAARMREFVAALRAIWRAWETGERLRFEGEHYRHTLMTPNFTPEPHPYGPPPVYLAAVGPKMTAVAGEVADGLLAHPFTTPSFLAEVTLPTLEAGAGRGRRAGADVEMSVTAFVATGPDERALSAAVAGVRRRIAFYGATPAYRPVLDHHGMGELQPRLDAMAREGRWEAMDALVPDELVDLMCVTGTPEEVGAVLVQRFGMLADRLAVNAPYELDRESADAVADSVRRHLDGR